MVATTFLLLLVQGLLQYPQQAGDGLDEAVLGCMEQRAEWFGLKKIRCNPDNSGQESSNSNLVEEKEGNNVVARKEVGRNNGNVEEDYHQKVKSNLGSVSDELIVFPVENLDKGCSMIIDPVDKLTEIFCQGLSDSFYLVPQEAIGVGSVFEGWGPRACDAVYCVLVPLSPPPGHAFHLELDTAGMAQRSFCVRVELLCTCMRKQLGKDMLCFLHHPEEELRRKQESCLLHTLCTGSYLDVEKTVQWFCRFVRVAWLFLPESCHWHLMLQPSSRSCKFQLSKDKESCMAEMVFGVRQGNSDIFVGSQPSQVGMASTVWLETYAMAEAKFFRHISRQAPLNSWHCKNLQLLAAAKTGVAFYSYALKTVVMHLLSTVPLIQWRRKDLGWWLMDTLKYLHCSLKTKQLDHFVIGNERFPMEISLPSDLRLAEPLNLFRHLASNPNAHVKATQEYIHLLHRLKKLLIHGP
ncbi:LOW QUALITY PROTEIN: inositol 1,4,5-trisphosphate receptor-interacting protein-like 1 [Pyrgilauda ruficollis]|uniref:LOW QUALITY PROTEIN: inositol 1,4,5-trisphosphate receptor-interacting protein-like 1 n=1 Tax=Pyrgilauda ruficollis TaxID=221976 RepID=UPI001B8763C2|nr:LOW QUALITY PROTEIN: inositol 1,4,5-trisphosphate receptor-interacting protein-like 1 [Pyrgilauda ruficollis]